MVTIVAALGSTLPSALASSGWYTRVKLEPASAGSGSRLTLAVKPPVTGRTGVPHRNRDVFSVRMARGTTFDPGAVPGRCSRAQAVDRDCPEASMIGFGRADLSGGPRGPFAAALDLYLGPRQHPGDVAGIVLVARAAGHRSRATGRIVALGESRSRLYGLQLSFEGLRRAFGKHSHVEGHVDRLRVHIGAHRTVAGRRHDLITNPSSCGSDGWPWRAHVGSPDWQTGWYYYGSVDCSP